MLETKQPKNKAGKPWLNDGWSEPDLDELAWINNESEELQQRIAVRDRRMEALKKKVQRQRETGCTAA